MKKEELAAPGEIVLLVNAGVDGGKEGESSFRWTRLARDCIRLRFKYYYTLTKFRVLVTFMSSNL